MLHLGFCHVCSLTLASVTSPVLRVNLADGMLWRTGRIAVAIPKSPALRNGGGRVTPLCIRAPDYRMLRRLCGLCDLFGTVIETKRKIAGG
jgi:hypothetical protein